MKLSGLFDMQMLCFMANLALITITDDHHCLLIYSIEIHPSLHYVQHIKDPKKLLHAGNPNPKR